MVYSSKLKAEDRRYDAGRDERVHQIEDAEEDYDKPRCLEEDAGLRLLMDAERAHAEEREHGEGAECEGAHDECTCPEAPGRECIDLHRLREAAWQKEGADTDEERGERVVRILQTLHARADKAR